MPPSLYVVMPSGQSYNAVEIQDCTKWWAHLEQTGRWWMATQVFPQNPLRERVRVAVAPFRDAISPTTGQWLVEFCFIAHGSTEVEARILVMRNMQRSGRKKKPSSH